MKTLKPAYAKSLPHLNYFDRLEAASPDQRGLVPLLVTVLIAVLALIIWAFLRVKGVSQ